MSGKKKTEVAFDLAGLRKAKRRLKQALREIEALEKHLVKFRDRQRVPTAEELAAVKALYAPFEKGA